MNHTYIEVEQVSFGYEKNETILKEISLTCGEGDSIGLIGANGAGKSTFLKMLVGLNLGFSGNIRAAGMPVKKETLTRIREKIGYVFQDSENQLFTSTVFEDIAFGPRNYGLSEAEVKNRVEHALELVNIQHLRDKQIYKMSGGEKKMVAIATILSMTPEIILMDEPSLALDPRNRRNLIRILRQFKPLKIIASHDLDMIMETCNRTILLSKGRIVADGNTKEILLDKALLEEHGLELPLCVQGYQGQ